MMKIISIISPVSGIVEDIGDDTITIDIRQKDNHNVYSPVNGILSSISSYHGSWTRHIFEANVNKIARVIVSIKNTNLNELISLWLEVGYPKYITDRIKIDKNINDNVYSGEYIGKIILGSLAEIHFNGIKHYNTIAKGSILIGGQTLITCIILSPDENNNEKIGNIIRDMCLQK